MKNPKKSSTFKKIIIGLLLVLFVALAALGSYYVLMATGITGLFPEGLFDFSQFAVPDDDASDLEGVIAKYEPIFAQLQSTAIDRLEELYQAAVAEYRAEKEAGTLNRFRLTNKYLQAGRRLESSVDKAFFMLLDGMEKELIRKNLPGDMIAEIEEAYEQTKKDKKEELFGRVREQIGR